MKRSFVIAVCLTAALEAYAKCPKGSEPYQDMCVFDIQPQTSEAVKPSDEKPPEDKMPSYEREGVKVINEPSTAAEDEKQDKENADALAAGKKAAGL